MSGEFTLEGIQKFFRGLDFGNERVRRGAERGMGIAAMALMNEAITEEPMVPLDQGTLRGSASVHVGRKLVGKSAAPSDPEATSHAQSAPPPGFRGSKDEFIATVTFNTPYATHLHEHPEYEFGMTGYKRTKGKRPPIEGTGGKYLERKLSVNRYRHMKVVSDEIQKELKNAQAP
jgi:hypothetical protein